MKEDLTCPEKDEARQREIILLFNKLYKSKNFELLTDNSLNLQPKESLYIAYAIVIKHSISTHFEKLLQQEPSKSTSQIVDLAVETTLFSDTEKTEPLISKAANYICQHKHDGVFNTKQDQCPVSLKEAHDGMSIAARTLSTRAKNLATYNAKKVLAFSAKDVSQHLLLTGKNPEKSPISDRLKTLEEMRNQPSVGCPVHLAGLVGKLIFAAVEREKKLRDAK